jgi:predicted transcriptional regulator
MKSNKTTDETRDPAEAMSDTAEMLRKNCEQALHTNLRLQEEAGRWWGSIVNAAGCANFQEQLNSASRSANSLLPLAQKRVGELIELAEKNSRTSADLVRKAVEAAQTQSMAESQTKWTEFWTASIDAGRANTEALSQIGAKAFDSWAAFVRTNAEVPNGKSRA